MYCAVMAPGAAAATGGSLRFWSADTWDIAARSATTTDEPQDELLLCVIAHDLIRGLLADRRFL